MRNKILILFLLFMISCKSYEVTKLNNFEFTNFKEFEKTIWYRKNGSIKIKIKELENILNFIPQSTLPFDFLRHYSYYLNSDMCKERNNELSSEENCLIMAYVLEYILMGVEKLPENHPEKGMPDAHYLAPVAIYSSCVYPKYYFQSFSSNNFYNLKRLKKACLKNKSLFDFSIPRKSSAVH